MGNPVFNDCDYVQYMETANSKKKCSKSRYRTKFDYLGKSEMDIAKEFYSRYMLGETIADIGKDYGYRSCCYSTISPMINKYVDAYVTSEEEKALFEERKSQYGRMHKKEIAEVFIKIHPEAVDEYSKNKASSEADQETTETEEIIEFDDCITIKDAISNIESVGGFLYIVDYGRNNYYVSGSYEEANSLFESFLSEFVKNKISASFRVIKMRIVDGKLYTKVVQEATLNYK